ncbi:MAG: hypothetical protein ING75_13710 [Rhodocyclaceae bacterium]|nr:hypothetical protein [Rhodocyclaceae bacterium]
MPYKFTKAYDYRGSSMGRRACLGDRKSPVKLYLNKVRLNAGGYDSGGAYWGSGEKVGHLWVAFGEETTDQGEQIEIFVRGFTRDKAKQAVLAERSNVSFFR